jgi:hypothetical protein
MPAKKKTTRSQRKVTVAASKRAVKKASKKKPAIKSKSTKSTTTKSTTKKRSPQRVAEATTSGKRKKTATKERARNIQDRPQGKSQAAYTAGSSRSRRGEFSGRQSGDLQGLLRAEQADSESVDELLEEGNPFEADVVKGVEDADDADEREVHTREVPEDDVPDEYFDKE